MNNTDTQNATKRKKSYLTRSTSLQKSPSLRILFFISPLRHGISDTGVYLQLICAKEAERKHLKGNFTGSGGLARRERGVCKLALMLKVPHLSDKKALQTSQVHTKHAQCIVGNA